MQVELNTLNKEFKASEEAKNNEAIIEDVIEQPIEETPTDTSEFVEEIPAEVEPSEQPIKETPTEVVENLE